MAVWWNNKMQSQIGNIFFSRRSSIICFLPSFHPSSFLPLSSFPPFLPQIHVDCLLCVSTVLSGRPAHFYLHPSGFSLWFWFAVILCYKKKGIILSVGMCAPELFGLDSSNALWALQGQELSVLASSTWHRASSTTGHSMYRLLRAAYMPLPLIRRANCSLHRHRCRQTQLWWRKSISQCLLTNLILPPLSSCPKEISFLGTSKYLAQISTSVEWKFQTLKIWWVAHFGKSSVHQG